MVYSLNRLRRRPQIKDDLKNEDDLKNKDDLKKEDDLKNEDNLKNEKDQSLEYPQGVVWKNFKISFSAIFHIFSCFEPGDHKSFIAGPYCFGLNTCLGT